MAQPKPKWTGEIETPWHPPEGFFEGTPTAIAQGLKKSSDDFSQALDRLNFYITRVARNLGPSDYARLDEAKAELYKLYR